MTSLVLAVSKLNDGLSSGIQGWKFYPENTCFNATVSFAYFLFFLL